MPNDPSQDMGQNRGYQINFGIPALGESFIHTGLIHDPGTLMLHEMGHALEDKLGNSNITHNYVKSRATSNEAEPLTDLDRGLASVFNKDEKALPTDFENAYAAKLYEGKSEVVSMATETLANIPSLIQKAATDRDHLLFGLYVLDQ
jgi:hypothetical protein